MCAHTHAYDNVSQTLAQLYIVLQGLAGVNSSIPNDFPFNSHFCDCAAAINALGLKVRPSQIAKHYTFSTFTIPEFHLTKFAFQYLLN